MFQCDFTLGLLFYNIITADDLRNCRETKKIRFAVVTGLMGCTILIPLAGLLKSVISSGVEAGIDHIIQYPVVLETTIIQSYFDKGVGICKDLRWKKLLIISYLY